MRRRTHFKLIATLVASVFAACFGRTVAAQNTPYQAVVVVDKVDARAGGKDSFYSVGEVKRGQTVTVAELFLGWYKIVPPEGMYSVITKTYVDAAGDGKSGVINSSNPDGRMDVNLVKAGASDPAKDSSWRPQLQLKKGDKVQIIGETVNDFKIAPPKGAFVFLPPGSLKPAASALPAPEPVTPAPISAPAPVHKATPAPAPARVETPAPFDAVETAKPAPAPAPSDAEPVKVKPAVRSTPAPAPAPPRVQSGAHGDSAAVQNAEARLQEAAKLPLSKQPLSELLAAFQAAGNEPNLSANDRRIVAGRSAQIRRNMEIAAGIKELQAAKEVGDTPIEMPKTATPKAGVYNPSRYDLVGQLLASGVYNGDTGPRLYRLVEPASMRTLAYVQGSRKFDPAQSLGKIVGIMGETRYDPALKLRVVNVDTIEVLEAAGDNAAPAKDTTPGTPTKATATTEPEAGPALPNKPSTTQPDGAVELMK